MTPRCHLLILVLSLVTASLSAELAPAPVHTPEQERSTFQFAEPGYRIELVACEPMVQDPVAIQFDGSGRLWVVEMRGYMRTLEDGSVLDPVGRVSVLEDLDGDGVMEKSTIFADGLVLPRAISVHPDGVLIGEHKALNFYQDTDGDLVADKITLVDADFARASPEHSANGLLRALDNRIYIAKEGHYYRRTSNAWTREETEPRGQWGICHDNQGRLYYNYNHSQLHVDLAPPDTLTRNPHYQPVTGLSASVTQSNAIFPIRPTLAANRGYIPGVLDEEGRIQEFTSACAPWIYRGHLFPQWQGDAFVCATVGNLIKRNVLTETGTSVLGQAAYPDRDFLASTDERFRPCWLTEGPDGALYIADMYRGIVQDGPHMSPYLREHHAAREMDRPIHLGRIWRIVPEDFTQPRAPNFPEMTALHLVGTLAHPSGWWRDQAQMNLVERRMIEAIPSLLDMALSHESDLARLHALWSLEGLGFDSPNSLIPVLADASPIVSAAAYRVLFHLGLDHGELARTIQRRAEGPLPESVRLQMVLTLGDLDMDESERIQLLFQLSEPYVGDNLLRDALLSSLKNRELAFLKHCLPHLSEAPTDLAWTVLLESLSQATLASRNPDHLAELLGILDQNPNWRGQAIVTATRVQGATWKTPVRLKSRPLAMANHEELALYFTWPGHEPNPRLTPTSRALDAREQALFARGRQIYLVSCMACHGADGKGMKGLAPPLAESDWVQGSPDRLMRVLLHGLSGPITVSGKNYSTPEVQPAMPPLANLSNSDLAAVLTYIRRAWDNQADPIPVAAVSKCRIESQGRTIPWTEAELRDFE